MFIYVSFYVPLIKDNTMTDGLIVIFYLWKVILDGEWYDFIKYDVIIIFFMFAGCGNFPTIHTTLHYKWVLSIDAYICRIVVIGRGFMLDVLLFDTHLYP